MDLAPLIEHTLLRADATPQQIESLCREAIEHRFVGVCVNPLYVPLARRSVSGSAARVVTVVAFPLGALGPELAALTAERSAAEGASELDLVIPIGLAKAREYQGVADQVAAVRDRTRGCVLKVILETGYFDEAELTQLVAAVLSAGPDFLKTSTGMGPRGATVEDVALFRRLAPPEVRIKASGGIRSRQQAVALVQAGAARIGTSNGVQLVV